MRQHFVIFLRVLFPILRPTIRMQVFLKGRAIKYNLFCSVVYCSVCVLFTKKNFFISFTAINMPITRSICFTDKNENAYGEGDEINDLKILHHFHFVSHYFFMDLLLHTGWPFFGLVFVLCKLFLNTN